MKKKMILAAMAFGICFGVQAQKPESSSYSLEAQFGIDGTPFSENNGEMPHIRGRYFLSNTMAIRGQIGFMTRNLSQPITEDFIARIGRRDQQWLTYGIGAGMEMHMEGTDRLSPYVGGQINFNRMIYNQEWIDADWSGLKPGYSEIETAASNIWGIDLVAGIDYYFAQNVYVGLEIGYYLNLEVDGDHTHFMNGNPVNVTEQDTEYNITPGSVNGIRLGWRF
jgi:hypothetical protein